MFKNLFGKNRKPSFANKVSVSVGPVDSEQIIPEYQGEYAQAVFLWANSKHCPIRDPEKYPAYIKYECGITDPVSFHKIMISEGFLEEDSIGDSLESLKLSELKEIAENNGLPTSGTKAKLAERIMGAVDTEYLVGLCQQTFSLSQKGKAFVEENDDCVQLHRNKNWMISWDEYKQFKTNEPALDFNSLAIKILRKRAAEDTNFFGRFNYLYISEIEEARGNYSQMLLYLMQIAYIDVSGISRLNAIKLYRMGIGSKEDLKRGLNIIDITPNPGIIEKMLDYCDEIDLSAVDRLFSWKLPMQLCDKKLFEKMMMEIKSGSYDKDYYEREMKKRYDTYINSL